MSLYTLGNNGTEETTLSQKVEESKAILKQAEALQEKDLEQAYALLKQYTRLSDSIYTAKLSQECSLQPSSYNHSWIIYTLICIAGSILFILAIIGIVRYIRYYREFNQPSTTFELHPTAIGIYPERPGNQRLRSITLTHREKQILRLCCKGLHDKEIARLLYISERTLHTHMNNIFQKCGVINTEELVRFAFINSLIMD